MYLTILALLQALDVCAARQIGHSSALSDPSECDDTLDSVLRTSLYPHDPEFQGLSCRRIAWWTSIRTRSQLLEKGYALYRLCENGMSMYPVNEEHCETAFPFARHGVQGPDVDLNEPILRAKLSFVVCMDLSRRMALMFSCREILLLLRIPKDST